MHLIQLVIFVDQGLILLPPVHWKRGASLIFVIREGIEICPFQP